LYERFIARQPIFDEQTTLSATAARFNSIEAQVPGCYLAAAGRASELAP
jgi:hypothetical protein